VSATLARLALPTALALVILGHLDVQPGEGTPAAVGRRRVLGNEALVAAFEHLRPTASACCRPAGARAAGDPGARAAALAGRACAEGRSTQIMAGEPQAVEGRGLGRHILRGLARLLEPRDELRPTCEDVIAQRELLTSRADNFLHARRPGARFNLGSYIHSRIGTVVAQRIGSYATPRESVRFEMRRRCVDRAE